jgi:hypothetical protein
MIFVIRLIVTQPYLPAWATREGTLFWLEAATPVFSFPVEWER